MKKRVLLAVLIIVVMCFLGCANEQTPSKPNGNEPNISADAPIYTGMSIASEMKNLDSKKIRLAEGGNDVYKVHQGEQFYFEIHFENEKEFEIQSFTLNGKKYANYMFEKGSTLETIYLADVGPNELGKYNYTIDQIKYIDGESIKDVKISGKQTITVNVVDCMIVLNPDGGLLDEKEFNISPNDSFELPTPIKTGYTFEGWFDENDNKITGGVYAYHNDLYLNAKWICHVSYTIENDTICINGPTDDNITELVILEKYEGLSTTLISESAFMNCTKLVNITIPDSITNIGDNAFENCPIEMATIPAMACEYVKNDKLKTVVITSGTEIWGPAFQNCTSLTSITIPESITRMVDYPFLGCSGLTSITVDEKNTKFDSRDDCNAIINTSTNELIVGCMNTIIPNSVTSIGGEAFYNCTSLTSITIPDSVTSIGVGAFEGCAGLTSITIPDSVTYLVEGTFLGCTSLTSITIPDSIMSIGGEAFFACTSLTSITIPDSVTSIGWEAFYNCTSLTSITIPDSVISIGDYAFYNCRSLTNITIPDSVTSIGSYAFEECTKLIFNEYDNAYYLGNKNNQYLVLVRIAEKNITSFSINEKCRFICSFALDNCTNLVSITIPDSVTSIGEWAFYGCPGLKTAGPIGSGANIEFDWETSIPRSAFSGCTSLASITIPDSVTSIEYGAFEGCTSLTSITIPDSVTSIGDCAFYNCTSLNYSKSNNANAYYLGNENNPYYYLIVFKGYDDAEFSIDERCKIICDCAFYNCRSLTSITIPNSVTRIGEKAFFGCRGLISITIPDSVTSIGEWAFSRCTSLTSITIPDSVTSIEYGAFEGCTSLTSITIPDSVTIVGGKAFEGCTSLTSIIIPGSVTSIDRYAFAGCTSLTSITIPDSVTYIGYVAFWDCINLTSVTIPDSVTTIRFLAFQNCQKATIYCEVNVRPDGWDDNWADQGPIVVWGYKK